MRCSRMLWFAIALAALWLLPEDGHATTGLNVLDVAELTGSSDLVVYGTVGRLESVLEQGSIFTYVDIEVDEPWKGPETLERTRLRLRGGEANGLRTWVIGAPCLDSGEAVVLFLRSNGPDTYDLNNLAQGKFTVSTDAAEGTVSRDLSGIHFLDPTRPPIPTKLDDLRSQVLASR